MENAARSLAPNTILRGLLLADRTTLAAYLALFESSTVSKLLKSWLSKVSTKLKVDQLQESFRANFDENDIRFVIKEKSDQISDSPLSDNQLRLSLWVHLRRSFNLPARVTLSNRGIDDSCGDLGAAIVNNFQGPKDERSFIDKVNDSSYWKDRYESVKARWNGELPTYQYAQIVSATLLDIVSRQLSSDSELSPQQQKELIESVRVALKNSRESTSSILEGANVEDLSDEAIKKILVGVSSLGGLGVAVEIAGFSAYIFAAQVSSIIPFVGGKTMVSLLAVLANPLFIIPAVGGLAYWGNRSMTKSIGQSLASVVSVLLSAQSVAKTRQVKLSDSLYQMFNVLQGSYHGTSIDREVWEDYQRQYQLHSARYIRSTFDLDPNVETQLDAPLISANRDYLADIILPSSRAMERDSQKNDMLLLSAISVGDVLYHLSIVDQEVVDAADFFLKRSIESNVAFSSWVLEKASLLNDGSLNDALSDGSTQQLKGHVAEQVVAGRLIEEGHLVEFPASANNAGYDLMVDGQPFQVKCREGLQGLREHFEKYPDIPVYANAELQPLLAASDEPWVDSVFFIEGYSNQIVLDMTNNALDAAGEVGETDIPGALLGIVAARNIYDWWKGGIDSREALWRFAQQGSTKSALALFGGVAGQYAGLFVFGPAGAVIGPHIGALLSTTGSGVVGNAINRKILETSEEYASWSHRLGNVVSSLKQAAIDALTEKQALIRAKQDRLNDSALNVWLSYRLHDECVFAGECLSELDQISVSQNKDIECQAKTLVDIVMRSHILPYKIQSEMNDFSVIWTERPDTKEVVVDRVTDTAQNVSKSFKRMYLGLTNKR